METRLVTNVDQDDEGDILALCNPGEDWQRVTKAEAIRHINLKLHAYYIEDEDGTRLPVRVVTPKQAGLLKGPKARPEPGRLEGPGKPEGGLLGRLRGRANRPEPSGPYLRASPDDSTENNLDYLDPCP